MPANNMEFVGSKRGVVGRVPPTLMKIEEIRSIENFLKEKELIQELNESRKKDLSFTARGKGVILNMFYKDIFYGNHFISISDRNSLNSEEVHYTSKFIDKKISDG